MRHHLTYILLLVVALLGLVACTGGSAVEPGAATPVLPSDTIEPEPTTAPATPTAAAEATAAPTATVAPTGTAEPAVLCPDVPRPALILTTGSGFELHDPLSGARCPLPLPATAAYLQPGGDRLYFELLDYEAGQSTVAWVGPDGVVEPLADPRADGPVHFQARFALSADGSRLAWTRMNTQDDPNSTSFLGSLWIGTADATEPVTLLEDVIGSELRIITPIRFSGDGATLFYTWEPTGLGGGWSAFNGRYDNLYRVPVAGGEPVKLFDCADMALFLCLGDFRDDGTLTYIDAGRVIHVNGPDGAEVAAIPTAGDYAGYPTFSPTGDLFYSDAVVPPDDVNLPLPTPGTVYRVAAPYTGAPVAIASANGLLVSAAARPFLDNDHLVVSYQEGDMWGSALLNMSGEITRLEPWPNAYLATVWPE